MSKEEGEPEENQDKPSPSGPAMDPQVTRLRAIFYCVFNIVVSGKCAKLLMEGACMFCCITDTFSSSSPLPPICSLHCGEYVHMAMAWMMINSC